MDLNGLILSAFEWLKSEPIIAIVIVCILAVLFYFKTKAMMKLLAIIIAIALLFYFINLFGGMTSTGVSQKEKMIENSQP